MKNRVSGRLVGRVASLAVLGLAALLLAMLAGSAWSATPAYVMSDLGTLGGDQSWASDINDSGQVVGYSTTASGATHAFSWTKAGGMIDLGTLGGRDSYVVGVNRSGQIVGYSDTTSGDDHAFSWTQAGGMIDLGILAGKNSYAEAVNDAGQVIGNADIGPFAGNTWSWHGFFWTQANGMRDITPISGGQARGMNNAGQVVGLGTGNRPFLWTQSGVMVLLGTGAGFQAGFAEAVNDAGQVVGCIGFPGTRIHAFSWTQAGGMVDLGDLVGGTRESWANYLNRSGEVAGSSQTPSGDHAFFWTQAGGMVDLGTLAGRVNSYPGGLNDAGQVVGRSTTSTGASHAFVWTQSGGMVDLGTLGGTESWAGPINDAGEIAGTSQDATGAWHAVIWRFAGDTTAPTLTTPGNLAVDATSAAGATIHYTVSAVDNLDPAPVVTCAPTSGTTFPIGDTTVTCTATDASGNTATASFLVHVRGAAEQLDTLAAAVKGVGPGTSLTDKVADVGAALSAGDSTTASSILRAFSREVGAQSGKKVAPDTAAALTTAAARIGVVIG